MSPDPAGRTIRWSVFLKDVLICSLGAYGGPEAHYGIFAEQLVSRKRYLTEEELMELVALTSMLPGPSSTQTIAAVGYKVGGSGLAFLALLVWAMPALILMTLLSFLSPLLGSLKLSQTGFRYIGPMAVGFIVAGVWRIGRKIIKDRVTLLLMIAGGVGTYWIRTPWIFPLVLLIGGAVRVLTARERPLWRRVSLNPPWRYLVLFFLLAAGSLLLTAIWQEPILNLFERFFRYGYLVIGGGQVVVPLMHSELVELHNYMTHQEFLTGFGLVQGLPGPMFSFCAYAGGMAARGGGMLHQLFGAAAGGIGIFLPGILLIHFVYPIWENLKKIRGIQLSLGGMTAVAGGLMAASALTLMQKSDLTPDRILATLMAFALLRSGKVPAPVIVVLTLAAGFVLPA